MSVIANIKLEYAPAPKRRRRRWVLAVLLVLILTGAGLAWWYRAPLKTEASRRWMAWNFYLAMQRCMVDLRRVDEIVYEDSVVLPPMEAQSSIRPARFQIDKTRSAPPFQVVQNTLASAAMGSRTINVNSIPLVQARLQAQIKSLQVFADNGGLTQQQTSAQINAIRAELNQLQNLEQVLQQSARSNPRFIPSGAVVSIAAPTTRSSANNRDAVVFLHQRTNDSSARRLVVVTATPTSLSFAVYSDTQRFSITSKLLWTQTFSLQRPNNLPPLRFYAGQPDPVDPRRFTIRFELGDRSGSLVGTLRNDGLIEIEAPGWIDSDSRWAPLYADFDPLNWRGTPRQLQAKLLPVQSNSNSIHFIDNDHLAVATPQEIAIIDINRDRIVSTIPIPPSTTAAPNALRSAAFLPGGKIVLIWNNPGIAQAVDAATGRTLWERTIESSMSPYLIPLRFSLDGGGVIARIYDPDNWRLDRYDARNGQGPRSVLSLPTQEAMNPRYNVITNAIVDPAHNSIFAGDASTLYRYRIDGGPTQFMPINDPVGSSRISASNDRLLLLTQSGSQIIAADTFEKLDFFTFPTLSTKSSTVLFMSPDGRSTVVADGTMIHFLRSDLRQVIRMPRVSSLPNTVGNVLQDMAGAISPDNQRFVLSGLGGQLMLYDLSHGVDAPMAKGEAMNGGANITLDYAPARKRRWRWVRYVLLALVMIGAGLAWWYWTPIKTEAKQRWYIWSVYRAQVACLKDLRPADEIVYEDVTAPRPASLPARFSSFTTTTSRTKSPLSEFQTLLGTPAKLPATTMPAVLAAGSVLTVSLPDGSTVRFLLEPDGSLPGTPIALTSALVATASPKLVNEAIVFMHERRNDKQESRLLIVAANSTHFRVLLYDIAHPRVLPKLLMDQSIIALKRSTQPLRLFAGQPDPSDPSAFNIRFEIGDDTGSIRGRLRSDSRVEFTPPGWMDENTASSGIRQSAQFTWQPLGDGFVPLNWRGTPKRLMALKDAQRVGFVAAQFIANDRLAIARPDAIQIIDPRRDQLVSEIQIESTHPPTSARLVRFSPDGGTLLIHWEPNIVQMVNVATGKTLWERAIDIGSPRFAVPFQFSMDGSQLMVRSIGSQIWRLESYDVRSGSGPHPILEMTSQGPLDPKAPFIERSIFDSASQAMFGLKINPSWDMHFLRYSIGDGNISQAKQTGSRLAASRDRLLLMGAGKLSAFSSADLANPQTMSDDIFDPTLPSNALLLSADAKLALLNLFKDLYAADLTAGHVIRMPRGKDDANSPGIPAMSLGEFQLAAVAPDNSRFVQMDWRGLLWWYDLSSGVDEPMAKVKP